MTFTIDEFTAAMEAAVEERGPDFVYPDEEPWMDTYGQCQYSLPDGTPACIIGLALSKLDPDAVPGHGAVYGASTLLKGRVQGDTEGETNLFLSAADNAQDKQDSRETWGQALTEYKDTLAENSSFLED